MPTATAIQAFVPAGEDYALAQRFFAAIGFEQTWSHDGVCGMAFGAARFILQDFHNQTMQENLMLVLSVDDLGAYWQQLDGLGLPERFAGVKIKPPTDYPWGRELHLIDPAGVCWHITQAGA